MTFYRRLRLRRALGDLHRATPIPSGHPGSLAAGHGATRAGQYSGGYRAVVWNAQAFFAARRERAGSKLAFAARLLQRGDFLMLTEAHGTEGMHSAWRPPPGVTAWWSAGASTAHAGVGLLINNGFLANFEANPRWEVIWPGRAAKLCLKGNQGSLELLVAYFHTGNEVKEADKHGVLPSWWDRCNSFPQLRRHLRHRIAGAIRPRHEALTIIGGDFNWTVQEQDRRSKSNMVNSGRGGVAEEKHFLSCMSGFEELFQEEMTHECDSAFSRIDRIYSNQHAAETIDRELRAAALEWRRDLSNHRPVFASRRLPDKSNAGLKPITTDIYTHRDFVRRVKLEWQERLAGSPDLSGLGRLKMLKAVMRDVGMGLARDQTGLRAAADDEDRLGVVMRYLRAAEQRCPSAVSRCLVRYPRIAELVANPYAFEDNLSQSLRALRDHAVELARGIALARLQAAQDGAEDGDMAEVSRRRKQGARLLYKLAPGRGGGLGAVVDQHGRVVTDSHGMADVLRRHWATVFAAVGVDEDTLGGWLAEDGAARRAHGPPSADWSGFRIRRRDVSLALRQAKNSSPGPDGIPYGAWRALGPLAVDTLQDALRDLASEEGARLVERDYPDFNESLIFFLPKTSTSTAPDGAPAFEAPNVRPLNVTNCDNRLVASAVRIALETKIAPTITQAQRGFLRGRSMLANVLDVDESMALAAKAGEQGLTFSFDLAAAFPSVEHDLFMKFFASLGWPQWLLRLIGSLYLRNYCWIAMGGECLEGFALTRGIRQGCPLSPLLFAMATDLILRRLGRRFPEATICAWADDMALVLPDYRGKLRDLQLFFIDLQLVAGLRLNVPKTVAVPLWQYEEATLRAVLAAEAPDWGGIRVATAMKYLGFIVGPGRQVDAWTAPVRKYLDRARFWGSRGLGLLTSLQAYRVFIASTLQFVAQLEELPPDFLAIEERAVRHLLPGPRGWMSAACAKDLRAIHFPEQIINMTAVALAAKARVHKFEAGSSGGLQVEERVGRLERPGAEHCSVAHAAWSDGWVRNSFSHILSRAARRSRDLLRAHAADAGWAQSRAGWQSRMAKLVAGPSGGQAMLHLRLRLDRWPLAVLRGHRVGRAVRVLEVLSRRSVPRVQAAMLRTWLNGWCTGRRFQQAGQCRFRCGQRADSVEHYAACPVTRQLLAAHLHGGGLAAPHTLDDFLCMTLHDAEDGVALRGAGVYAAYRLFNLLRTGGLPHNDLAGAFRQFALFAT